MTPEFKLDKKIIDIPKNTGRAGFILAIEKLLKLPRIQNIQIDAKGKVTYTRFVKEDDPSLPLAIDLASVSPYGIIRNSELVEINFQDLHVGDFLLKLFNTVANDKFFPICFVGSLASSVWPWLKQNNEETVSKEQLLGYPFYEEGLVENYMLFLCTGIIRESALIDTVRSYKIILPLEFS